jgi:CubicO group peptidase (beta-lactamase class C family)|tara:strand:+ start:1499 stop:2662 length:1164 start_codon:yes stop_codon:yes gene_type:complete
MSEVMQGFPPAEPNRASLANWRKAPYCHWAFHHVREIIPSAEISNDPTKVWELEPSTMDTSNLGLDEAMARTDCDAVVVLHKDKLVHESYRNGMTSRDPHILMSVSKSMLGLVAGTLVERGELAEDDLITKYVPELENTAYVGATVRDLLDMRAGVLFDEDYLATEGPIIDYRYAANWNPVPKDHAPIDLRSFMSLLTEPDGPHGGRFHYVSPNTDLLAWVFERASGMRYAKLVSERLWKPLGAEAPGYITVDRIGGARAAGGKCFLARDLARVGMMMANGGQRNGKQVVPSSWLEDIVKNGDPQAWKDGDFYNEMGQRDIHYRSKWYVKREAEPLIFGVGIHGQFLFVDPAKKLSISWFASQDSPLDGPLFEKTLSIIEKIRGLVS